MTAPARFPRFFVTSPGPCPYLEGKTERKVFTELNGEHADEMNKSLGRIGFRRSQNVAYRPNCVNCNACVSVRVAAQEFSPDKSQRKILKRNKEIEVSACRAWATQEQFALLKRYLDARHPGGGMAEMDDNDFADMVEHSPVRSYMIEYREPSHNGQQGALIGACLTDQHADGLSMVYSFFDPDHKLYKGLGNFIIMDHIVRSARAGLPYVYLGYWVKNSPHMQYKTRYQPMEYLTQRGWSRQQPEEIRKKAAPVGNGAFIALDERDHAVRDKENLDEYAYAKGKIPVTSGKAEQKSFKKLEPVVLED